MYSKAYVNTVLQSSGEDTADYRVIINNTQIKTTVTRKQHEVRQWLMVMGNKLLTDEEDNENSTNNIFGLELKWVPGKKWVFGRNKGLRKPDKMALMIFCIKVTCLVYQMIPKDDLNGFPAALLLTIRKSRIRKNENIFVGFGIEKKVQKARESEEISYHGNVDYPLFPMTYDARQCFHPALSYFPNVKKASMRGLGRIVFKTDIAPTNKVTSSFRKRKPTFNSGSSNGRMIFNLPAIKRRYRTEKAKGHTIEISWDDHYLSVDQVEHLTISAYTSYIIGITMFGSPS